MQHSNGRDIGRTRSTIFNVISSNSNGLANAADHSLEQVAENMGKGRRGVLSGEWMAAISSLVLLAVGLLMDHIFRPVWFGNSIRPLFYVVAYAPVAIPVIGRGLKLAVRGEIFTEFTLMTIATLGAFLIAEYPEAVAVMVFYAIGELFQGAAVRRAKRNIKALLDVRPATATVYRQGTFATVDPSSVEVNETIQVRPGERVPLDGTLTTQASAFNTAALTGESEPRVIEHGSQVLAGMINDDRVVELKVTRKFEDSALSRILALVEHAQGRKARTELFIRRFARAYTPIVVFLALSVVVVPYFFVGMYDFREWLYRGLIFLVISCPCALVVAIPLGYFGGIGAGSRNGILFKGSTFLDNMARLEVAVFDKTGTLTMGNFSVKRTVSLAKQEDQWLPRVAALASTSNHPVSRAIVKHVGATSVKVSNVQELRGLGLVGHVDGEEIIAGNERLFRQKNIPFPNVSESDGSALAVAVGNVIAGYAVITDDVRHDARQAIKELHAMKVRTMMLSGDRQQVVDEVASTLNIDGAYGELLPEMKVEKLSDIRRDSKGIVAFVGDGINDAPAIAASDVGIAMGALGSDAAIETADVVIQGDQLPKIAAAVKIGKATRSIVWQNISLAFGVKLIVLALGTLGLASMWEAVFADVGVALLAILNAVRIQYKKF